MIPLIQAEILNAGWLSEKEFADIVSISQVTPGPIGINAATYVGFKTAGFSGSVCATLGVFLPSFLLIIAIAHFITKFKNNRNIEAVFLGIRPATIGLISVAVIFFAQMSIFLLPLGAENIGRLILGRTFDYPFSFAVNPISMLIFTIVLIGITRFKLSSINALIISAILGILLF